VPAFAPDLGALHARHRRRGSSYGGQAASVASPLPLPALPTWLAEGAARDGCPGEPDVFLDTAEVTGVRWSGCRAGTEVVHYRINGGGH
jgi:poly(3-hydroxybutyrate) depolymerase